MDSKERLELLEHLFEQLRLKSLDFPILVEGKRDRDALINLGIDGEILIVNTGHSIMEMCEDLSKRYTEVILMLDWDSKGKELSKSIEHNLMHLGIKTDRSFMVRIFHLASKETKEVEALDKFMERLRIPTGMEQNRLNVWRR